MEHTKLLLDKARPARVPRTLEPVVVITGALTGNATTTDFTKCSAV
jgi:hypothetical protein